MAGECLVGKKGWLKIYFPAGRDAYQETDRHEKKCEKETINKAAWTIRREHFVNACSLRL